MKRGIYCVLTCCFVFIIASCADENNSSPCVLGDYSGVWDINETCGGSNFQYPLTISENGSGILLSNLGGLGPNAAVNATVSGSKFTIPAQTVQGVNFSGNGTLLGGCVEITYSWTGSPKGNCTATGSK